jgi:hypothetical protein
VPGAGATLGRSVDRVRWLGSIDVPAIRTDEERGASNVTMR